MSRTVYPTAQVPIEVQDESVATTLKVIMDVLKVSRLKSKKLQAVYAVLKSCWTFQPMEASR